MGVEMYPQRAGESEFDWGLRVGFDDAIIPVHLLTHYSADFQKGFWQGKGEIEELVQQAANSGMEC